MFYFIHQIKLETIPYVQKEIQHFINYFQQHLNKVDNMKKIHEQQNISEQSRKTIEKLFHVMVKKYKQIQLFYYNNWMDYRAQLILRAKALIGNFYLHNRQLFHTFIEQQQQKNAIVQREKYDTPDGNAKKQNSRLLIVSEFDTNSNQKIKTSEQTLNSKIKQSVQFIKTQIEEKPLNQKLKTPKNSLKQNKKLSKSNINLSKDEIQQEVNKIIEKQKVKQKSQSNSLVFVQKKKQQPKNEKKTHQKIIQQSKHQSKDKKIIDKYINNTSKQKSVSKAKSKSKQIPTSNKLTQRVVNLSKIEQSKLTKSIQRVKQPQTPMAAKFRNKKMTKQEYVQYLVNKNRQQNKKGY